MARMEPELGGKKWQRRVMSDDEPGSGDGAGNNGGDGGFDVDKETVEEAGESAVDKKLRVSSFRRLLPGFEDV